MNKSTLWQLSITILLIPFLLAWLDLLNQTLAQGPGSFFVDRLKQIIGIVVSKNHGIILGLFIYPIYSLAVFGITARAALITNVVHKTFIPLSLLIILLPLFVYLAL